MCIQMRLRGRKFGEKDQKRECIRNELGGIIQVDERVRIKVVGKKTERIYLSGKFRGQGDE